MTNSLTENAQQKVDRSNFSSRIPQILQAAENRAQEKQHAKGRQTARERIALLIDDGEFEETSCFAGGNIEKGDIGSSVITGFGKVDGRPIAVYAQDFSIQGGTLGEVEGQKIIRLMREAMRLQVPIVSLLDSGGARIQEGVAALAQYGRLFKVQCDASGVIPQISIILGPCAGGAVYGPALTDFVIMTKKSSYMFVTGPGVVKAVTGESVSQEDLGGGDLHNVESGVAHFLADDENDAIECARSILSYLPSNCRQNPPTYHFEEDDQTRERSRTVAALVPESSKQSYDMISVIEALTDHGEFLEVHALFASNVVVGFACFNGQPVGIVANQPLCDAGTLDILASEKVARFVQFCDAFSLPVVTLVDVPGYRPGSDQERSGIIRRGAKVITAYATATVPMVTVILRKAYGGAYIVMGSKSLGADFNYSWPATEIAVMGSEGAVDIVYRKQLSEDGRQGLDVDAQRLKYQEMYAQEAINPTLSLNRGELDALIDPADTRSVICRSLQILKTKDRTVTSPRYHANPPV